MSLTIKNLKVKIGNKVILKGINLSVNPGEIHAIMGPNGSGKSTFAHTLMGDENLELENSEITIDGRKIDNLPVDERAQKGLFLAFQTPVSIPGINIAHLLLMTYENKTREKRFKNYNPALSVKDFYQILAKKANMLEIKEEMLGRSLNENFSGGEKKKLELLQALILKPKYAIFDEIDTGVDIDALRIIATGIKTLQSQNTGVIIITHYLRILRFCRPHFVHILIDGKIVESGDYKLAKKVEKVGYQEWQKK